MLEIVTPDPVLRLPAVKVVFNRYLCNSSPPRFLLLPAKLDATDLCGSIPFCRGRHSFFVPPFLALFCSSFCAILSLPVSVFSHRAGDIGLIFFLFLVPVGKIRL